MAIGAVTRELVGIDALARTLFAKAPHGLQDQEAAIAAALVRAPNARPALVAERACGVLKAMRAAPAGGPAAKVDCVALDMQTEVALSRRAFVTSDGVAPHAARRVLAAWRAAHPGQALPPTVASTLDARIQRVALQSLTQQIKELRGRHVEDGAVLVLDNASGQVLAWVGSTGALSAAAEVDGVLAPRQPGSTLKPFLYAQAMAERRLTAASLIDDSPADLQTGSGLYIPQNYDRRFKGWVSARTALASSLNVPAVRTLVMITPDAFFEQLKKLGLPLRESGGYYGFSLALGSSEVALLNLTNAYRALGNSGQYRPVSWALPQTESRKAGGKTGDDAVHALDARAAFIVGDILSDNMARAPTFGTDSVLATRFWTAVKTGTSKDMRDNWAVGWSERYTVGVWVGNAGGEAMHSVSGTSGAAPIWADIMGFLHRNLSSRAPRAPVGVLQQQVQFGALASGGMPIESARGEWFVAGTEQSLFAMDHVAGGTERKNLARQKASKSGSAAAAAAVRISRPANGTILALDPDIPPDSQRVQLVARQAGMAAEQDWRDSRLRWRLVTRQYGAPATADKNAQPVMREVQRELGRGSQLGWLPWPGRHKLELLDASGKVLDSIALEVRGAGALVAGPEQIQSQRRR